MIIVMRRPPGRGKIVGRVLDGNNLVMIDFFRDDDNPAGMLPGRTLHAGNLVGEANDLATPGLDSPALEKPLDESPSHPVGDRRDGAGAEGMILPEKLAQEIVGAALILAGKIQVDVGNFVSLDAEKRLERDIDAVAAQIMPAKRALGRRQVISGPRRLQCFLEKLRLYKRRVFLLLFIIEFNREEIALRAIIMGREGVNLGDSHEKGHEAGSYRSAAADDIARVAGMFHEQMRYIID